jgi:hypothetical protein
MTLDDLIAFVFFVPLLVGVAVGWWLSRPRRRK